MKVNQDQYWQVSWLIALLALITVAGQLPNERNSHFHPEYSRDTNTKYGKDQYFLKSRYDFINLMSSCFQE